MPSKPLMKISLSLSLLGAFALLTACEDEPPVKPTRHPSRYPAATPPPYPPPPTQCAPSRPPTTPVTTVPGETTPQPPAAPVNKPTKGARPYGIPVPNKPG